MAEQAKNTTGAPSNGGQSINPDSPKQMSAKKLALTRRRMDGARQRVARLEGEVADVMQTIKRKSVPIPKKKADDAVRYRRLNSAEIAGYRGELLELKKMLTEARFEHGEFRKQSREASLGNNQLKRVDLAALREWTRMQASIPTLVDKSLMVLASLSEEKTKSLVEAAKAKDEKVFRVVFHDNLEGSSVVLLQAIEKLASVRRKVVREVRKHFANVELPEMATVLPKQSIE